MGAEQVYSKPKYSCLGWFQNASKDLSFQVDRPATLVSHCQLPLPTEINALNRLVICNSLYLTEA